MKANELYKKNSRTVQKKQNAAGRMLYSVMPYGKDGKYGHTVITKTGYKNVVPGKNGSYSIVQDKNGSYRYENGPSYFLENLGDYQKEPINFLEKPAYSQEVQKPIVKKPKPIGPFKGSPEQNKGTLEYNPFDTTSNLFITNKH